MICDSQYTEHGKRIASQNGETQCSLNVTKPGITNLQLVENNIPTYWHHRQSQGTRNSR